MYKMKWIMDKICKIRATKTCDGPSSHPEEVAILQAMSRCRIKLFPAAINEQAPQNPKPANTAMHLSSLSAGLAVFIGY